jgi:hypothetical protein
LAEDRLRAAERGEKPGQPRAAEVVKETAPELARAGIS